MRSVCGGAWKSRLDLRYGAIEFEVIAHRLGSPTAAAVSANVVNWRMAPYPSIYEGGSVMFRVCFWSVVLVAGIGLGGVRAQGFIQTDRVTLQDIDPATNNGRLGRTLALAGDIALLGAPEKDGLDGAVYAFSLDANGQLSYISQVDPQDDTYRFGLDIAASGRWAGILETGNDLRFFERSGNNFVLRQTLPLPATQNDIQIRDFTRIAMEGEVAVVGDDSAIVNGTANAGAAMVYRRSGSAWNIEALIPSPSPGNTGSFGEAVAISNDVLLVGAKDALIGTGSVGLAYIYRRINGAWALQKTLSPSVADQVAGNGFGWSVALDGDTAVVGCANCNDNIGAPSNSGSLYVFRQNQGGTNQWGMSQELSGSQPGYIDRFSFALRLRGDSMAVTAPGAGDKLIYLFARPSGGSFSELDTLQVNEGGNSVFGSAVDFINTRTLVGADSYPDQGSSPNRYGAVYAFANPVAEACLGLHEPIFCNGYEGGSLSP